MEKGWRVILAFVGIFAAGALTGGLLTLRVVQSRPATPAEAPPVASVVPQNPPAATPAAAVPQPVVPPPPPAPEQLGPQLFRRLTNQLDLTPAQRAKIRPIELRASEELNRLRRESVHSTQVLIDQLEDEIRALLTPEQQAKFQEGVARAQDKIQKYVADQQRRQREQREKMFPNRAGNPLAAPAGAPGGEKK